MIPLLLALVAAISYVLGSISSGRLLARYVLKQPVRRRGYVGFTAFERQFGRKWALVLVICDVAKSAAAILLGGLILLIPGDGFPVIGRLFAGFCVVLGDVYPWQFRLHGGRGVVAMMTACWLADWRIGLFAMGVLIAVVAITQYMSLACLAACFTGTIAAWIFVEQEQMKGVAGLVMLAAFLLILWRYRGNVSRLLGRTEPKVAWGRRPESRLRDDDF